MRHPIESKDDQRRGAAFMELYAPCQRRLFLYIVMLTGDTTVASDILQDTNVVLWEKSRSV